MGYEEKRKTKYHPHTNFSIDSIILRDALVTQLENLRKTAISKSQLKELAEALAKIKRTAQPWQTSIRALEDLQKAAKPRDQLHELAEEGRGSGLVFQHSFLGRL